MTAQTTTMLSYSPNILKNDFLKSLKNITNEQRKQRGEEITNEDLKFFTFEHIKERFINDRINEGEEQQTAAKLKITDLTPEEAEKLEARTEKFFKCGEWFNVYNCILLDFITFLSNELLKNNDYKPINLTDLAREINIYKNYNDILKDFTKKITSITVKNHISNTKKPNLKWVINEQEKKKQNLYLIDINNTPKEYFKRC